jgi:hypothetical protein
MPWLVAAVTAAWFGLMARRVQASIALWALGGGFFALIVTTIVWGLGQASSIPFSDRDTTVFHVRWTLESAVLVAIGGGLLALQLRKLRPEDPAKPAEKP